MTAMQTDPIVLESTDRVARPGVVERLTQILDVFIGGPDRLLLEDVTGVTGLPRSTAFRILSQLVDLEWLEHDTRGYRLGARVHDMGSRRADHSNVRAAAADTLNDLHLATRAVAHLVVLEGSAVHYLDKVGGPAAPTIPSVVGLRVLAHNTISGMALLACLPPERVDGLMALHPESAGRTDLTRLHTHLSRIRHRHGVASTPDDMPTDIRAVAAPVLGPEGAVAAISVAARGRDVRLENMAPMVAFAARRTSQRLFPSWTGTTGQPEWSRS